MSFETELFSKFKYNSFASNSISKKKIGSTTLLMQRFVESILWPLQCYLVLPPDRFIANGIEVTDVQYGLNNTLGQPELHSVNAIIQIYSNGSDLSANVIKERCQQYNQDETSRPQFLLIVFYSNSKQELTRIEAKYPNAAGNIIETKSLYSNISSIANVG